MAKRIKRGEGGGCQFIIFSHMGAVKVLDVNI